MLSFASRKIFLRGTQFNVKFLRNNRLNGTVSDAKAARAARKVRTAEPEAAAATAVPVAKSPFTPGRLIAAFVITITGACAFSITTDREGVLGKEYWGSPLEKEVSAMFKYFFGWMNTSLPYEQKLLPDWPTDPFYGNPPAGAPCPPCLVLDLEKTLIGSEHSAQYGWRHVKRPGLTQFIEKLSKYYEIVIFTENDIGVMSELIAAIDPEGCVPHRFGSAQAEKRDGAIIKRLDFMNRDLSQVILIDDSTVASQMFPRNTLLVKPFNDVNDATDTVLYDLVPLLQALIHDQSADFRETLDDLGTHEAEEACIEYKMRVSEKKRQEAYKRNRGIGGLVRSKLAAPTDLDPTEFRSTVLTASQIVGASPDGILDREGSSQGAGTIKEHKGFAGKPIIIGDAGPKPPVSKKKGAIFSWFEEAEREREEIQARKKEKLEQIYIKKMTDKANSKPKSDEDEY